MAAKAERVGDGNIDRHLNRLVRSDIQIALRIRLLVADSRRYNALADCHNAGNGLNRSRAAQQMAGHGLGGGYLHVVSLLAKRLLDGNGLILFIQRRGGAVRVDIVNVSRGQTGILDGAADSVCSRIAVRRRAGDVVSVAGGTVACHLCQNGRAALLCVRQALEYETACP